MIPAPAELREALAEARADGWLLFDFHGLNPVAGRILGLGGLATRRIFVLLPKEGDPVAVAHRIELQALEDFPGRVIPYAGWQELHAALGDLVHGRTLAMEISPEDAVPYLDRVPYGVIELLRRLGATVVPSGALVSRFAARWTPAEAEDHRAAAEVLASVARAELARAVTEADAGLTESALQARVVQAAETRGLVFNTRPIVGFGANAAMPHYEPHPGRDATLRRGDVVLLDLWAGRSLTTVFADQTWMGFAGADPPERVRRVWTVVRDARDAAVTAIRAAAAAGRSIAGYEADRAARGVIEEAGYGSAFVHRTGHSIDRDLHGSGPHLDDFETHDDRRLTPGVGFSVEPGIYLAGEFGVRSEVNMYWGAEGPEVTPREPQRELILAPG
ncbi:MAG TPA: M24 family metallopeptidase [Gemmatimonadales bacterium]|jgi:Xaa-Pro aminopeptidase|nr:M24 family metallopeptidase [Gemmatimonadales bacterium]